MTCGRVTGGVIATARGLGSWPKRMEPQCRQTYVSVCPTRQVV